MERQRFKETNETVETVGDQWRYMQIQTDCMERQRERLMETKETVETMETSGDTCKYKIVWRD